MKTKLLAILMLAGSSLFAKTHFTVGIGIGYGGYGYGYYAPPVVAYRPPYPGPGYAWVNGYWVSPAPSYAYRTVYWSRPRYVRSYWVAPRYHDRRYYRGYWRR